MKVIKNEAEYKVALSEIRQLLDLDPDSGTTEADRLELLSVLVEKYESERIPTRVPDPIEAIVFRMEQQSLTQRDLVPLIGSRSKVSEVLSRKRPLTLQMIRALHTTLGIPAATLLQGDAPSFLEDERTAWLRFPLKEMISYGWIKGDPAEARNRAQDYLRQFFAPLSTTWGDLQVLYRRSENVRSAREMDQYALMAWTARVTTLAKNMNVPNAYRKGCVSPDFMARLAKQSWSETGPLLARELLSNCGIALVIERHLPKTRLDGAAIMISKSRPIIALTLRYDRIDNFWFTLMHELAHVALHHADDSILFYDDLDVESQGDGREREADELAGEALIPEKIWKKSPASALRSPEAAVDLAKQLGIHPAIVAGRMRREFKAYKLLNNLVGHGKVRRLFPEVNWE